MALYAYLIVAMYPAVKSDLGLESLATDNPTMLALLGVAGSLTSPVGWVSGNLYANFLPLLLLLLTIGYGASSIAGQSDEGTLALLATLPVSRIRMVAEKTATLIVLALPLALVTMACVFVGRHYELVLETGPVLGATAAVGLLAVDFGLLAMLIGVASSSRGLAIGLTSAVAAASYLVSSLAPVNSVAHDLRGTSLFYWSVGDGQLSTGPSALAWTVLALAGIVLFTGVLVTVKDFDIR